jgi:hypothetical protein
MQIPRQIFDAADTRALAMLLVGTLLATVGVLWVAVVLGLAVMLFRVTAGG